MTYTHCDGAWIEAGAAAAGGFEVEDLSVRRGGRLILDRVSLRCPAGAVTALLGGNGAGKSTLLATLAGDLAPAAGEIRLNGRPLSAWSPGALARLRAVLGQSTGVALPFTALEVVRLGRLPWGDGPGPSRSRAQLALAQVGAGPFAERPCTALSGGELQRVMLARALAQVDPPVHDLGPTALLLDEPTSAQDLAGQQRIMARAWAAARAGRAVVAVLHDPNLAARFADHVVLLAGGRICAAGPPAEVLQPEALTKTYGVAVRVQRHADGAVWIAPATEPGGPRPALLHEVNP